MTLEEFYEKIDSIESDEFGCMFWPNRSKQLYNLVWINEIGLRRGHRLVLERKLNQPIKPKYFALHTCDHKGCLNQDHIYEGTQNNNMQDHTLRYPGWVDHLKKISSIGGKRKYEIERQRWRESQTK